ncbi:MAG: ABC transporter substrate-binding protein [Dehalococcoidia bacterium]
MSFPRRGRTVTRRSLLGGAAGAAFLIACGSNGDDGNTVAPAAVAPAATSAPALRLLPASPTDLGAPAAPPAAAATTSTAVPYEPTVAVYAKYGTDAAPGVFPRTIRHAMGETTIKAAPQRVVVLDTGERDAVVDMGIRPVGSIAGSAGQTPAYLGDALEDAAPVGTIAEPDIEAIAVLRPDVILSNKLRHEAQYNTFAAIAPTVFGERAGLVWRHNYALYAQALGREEHGAATVAQYDKRVRQLNARLPAARPSVSVIRVLDGNVRYYQRANFIGIVLTDLGFPRPESQNVDDFGLVNLGLETLGQYGDADLIVLSIVGGDANAFGKELQGSPVWKTLKAAQKGAVLTVDDGVWIGGLGYKAASIVHDDIAAYFKV